ncbi:hypothetical protein [Bradyrhizobium sp.]|jgi:hypothetical protein|uniref:hypothetical protein n=1 Tax=Bradyrhizobium sp. TaxID=376 RepID=UPI002DDCE305|nr:hypothetical protein [Bradyrhizobium sp.]HEV2153141.1 hypothetical protein [Bradyrhizobium sp.]
MKKRIAIACAMLSMVTGAWNGPADANEKLGLVVRRLADACVGTIISAGALEKVVRSSMTATVVCSCAAEIEVARGNFPKESFDAWAVQPQFKETLVRCAGAQ